MTLHSRSYFVCTTPRSGSFLLCEGLTCTQIAGWPEEYFDEVYQPFWRKRLAILGSQPILPHVLARRSTDNGVFGAKILWYQLEQLVLQFGGPTTTCANLWSAMKWAFPGAAYIWLTRRDKVAQAVSYYRAVETDVWWNIDDESPAPKRKPEFNAVEIEKYRRLILDYEQGWREYFKIAGVKPYVIVYEDFIHSYESTIRGVLEYLQLTVPDNLQISKPRLKRQADDESAAWVKRFQAMSKEGTIDSPQLGISELDECTGPKSSNS